MVKIFQNVSQKTGLSFVYTYGRFEPKLRRISVENSNFLLSLLNVWTLVRLGNRGKKQIENGYRVLILLHGNTII